MSDKILTNVWLEREQRERITATGKGMAETIREAIDFYLNSGVTEKDGAEQKLLQDVETLKTEIGIHRLAITALVERINKLESQLPEK